MDGMLVLVIVIVVGFILIRFAGSSTPNVNKNAIKSFAATLPEGFYYPYYLDWTGFALNVAEGKIYLVRRDNSRAKSYSKVYEREQIRNIYWEMQGYQYTIRDSKAPGVVINNALNKREAKHSAYKDSGIFIQVADIEHPTWQIRFSSKPELERNFEILQQFMEGTLPEPTPSKTAN